MKLAVLGGGGVRTPFLAKSLAMGAAEAGLSTVVLMDIDEKKLARFGKIAQHIVQHIRPQLEVQLTTSAEEALIDADFIITTIRAEGDAGRVFDETTALAHGVLGQETTGAGGFAMALRSIPTLLEYCALATRLAKPGAPIFNFTNPSGLVTQALRSQGYSQVYGVCDAPSGFFRQLHMLLGRPEADFTARCFGLNHLSWFDRFTLDGQDATDTVMNHPELYTKTELRLFDPGLIHLSDGLLPNEYLFFYYYPEKTVAGMGAGKTRGQVIQEVNKQMDASMSDIDIDADFDAAFECYMRHYAMRENSYFALESGQVRPELMAVPTVEQFVTAPDAGSYAGVALAFIKAKNTGRSTRMVLSVPNAGCIDGLADGDVAELSCTITSQGVVPDRIGAVPSMQMNLIRQVKLYENLTVEAIMEKDFSKAVKALTVHPLIASYPTAKALAGIYIGRYGGYVGEWPGLPAKGEE